MAIDQRAPNEVPALVRDVILIILGAAALMWPAILNRFPLIFHDTNSYVRFGLELHRSIFYKLFVFFTGLHWTIWSTAIAQAAISSALILCFVRLLDLGRVLPFLVIMLCLAVISSLPVFAMFIMPDVFTGLMFLTLFMVIFLHDRMTGLTRAGVFALLLLFISSHLSHLVLALAITAASTIALWLWAPRVPRAGIAMAFGASILVAGCFVLYNGVMHRSYSVSPAGSTFLLANLIEYGPARLELADHCPRSGYRLCAYQNRLPAIANDFLWSPESPFNTDLGGFDGMRGEAGSLVRDTLKHQTMWVLSVTVRNSVRALHSVNPASDVVRMEPTVEILQTAFRKVFGIETVRQFDASAQESNRFPVTIVATLNYAGLALAITAIAVLAVARFRPSDWRIWAFCAFALASFMGNAVLCAAVSGVSDRYQARMSWLIILAALLLLCDRFTSGRRVIAP